MSKTKAAAQFLDVWIVESNTVYREVPFNVVTDWVQQGRLLAEDMLRQAGGGEWTRLADSPSLAAYLPREEPYRAEDQAEALEPVQIDFAWKARRDDEEEDVDMIPLIDVSLVLLIFFMMTATVASTSSLVNTPRAQYGNEATDDPGMPWVGVELAADGTPFYSFGLGSGGPKPADRQLNLNEALDRLDAQLRQVGPVDVRIKADEETPDGAVKRLRTFLDMRRAQGILGRVFDEVREGENQ